MSLLRSLVGKLRSSVLLRDYLKSKHLAPLPPLTTSHPQSNFYYYCYCSTPAMISSHGSKDDQFPHGPQGLGSVGQKIYETQDDHEARRLAQFTINKHNAEENEQLQFVRVVEARGQGVTGMRYSIKLEAIVDSEPVFYFAAVWERRWLKSIIVLVWKRVDADFSIDDYVFADYYCSTPAMISSHGSKDACDDKFPQRPLMLCSVGPMKYETWDDHMRRLAQFPINKHNAKENEQLQFVRVVKVRRMRVAGMRYAIKLEAIVDSKPVFYLAELWERSWLNSLIVRVWKRVDADFSIDDYVFDRNASFYE